MEDRDLMVLSELVEKYRPEEMIHALKQAFEARADELADLYVGEKAKEFSRAAFHLDIYRPQQ